MHDDDIESADAERPVEEIDDDETVPLDAEHGKRKAEQDREEENLEDITGKGVRNGGDDVYEEINRLFGVPPFGYGRRAFVSSLVTSAFMPTPRLDDADHQ